MALVPADPMSARARDTPRAAGRSVPRQATGSDAILALQRSAGNRAVGAMLRSERGGTLARCAGACRCGGRCQDDDLLEERRGRHRLAD